MGEFRAEKPLIVQADFTVLAEVASPEHEAARDCLTVFAELLKSPEYVHTYRITPLSIWNACSAGHQAEWIVQTLRRFAKYPVPDSVVRQILDLASRYGRLELARGPEGLELRAAEAALADEIGVHRQVSPLLGCRLKPNAFSVPAQNRGLLKQALVRAGFPARDVAGYVTGDVLEFGLRETTLAGRPFALRHYQRDAARAFHAEGRLDGGSGVIVLPCGAGKTIVALACMQEARASTLVLCTNITAARQWISEILDKTTLTQDRVGEYSGHHKQVRPVTVATYHILTHRSGGRRRSRAGVPEPPGIPALPGAGIRPAAPDVRDANGTFPAPSDRSEAASSFTHLRLFDERNWGLIIYDEVHLLPAPVFQVTASLQARRRLGLTATLVREDGREDDVFALIGPKKAEVPWRRLERQGWIAAARCTEIRLPLPKAQRSKYALSGARDKFRLAAENPRKQAVARALLQHHAEDQVLVIGTYLDQLRDLSEELDIPLLTGATPQSERDELYRAFRGRSIRALAVSKVANFSVDLPDAAVAIQISGTFGSRQEEAQRLGRILRPKPGENRAHFYTLVTRDTVEQDFALRRQLFLCEQGYEYRICDTAAAAAIA